MTDKKIQCNNSPDHEIWESEKAYYHVLTVEEQLLNDGVTRTEIPTSRKIQIYSQAQWNWFKKYKEGGRDPFVGRKVTILHDPTKKPKRTRSTAAE
jgi:hypothetical protein